MITLAIDQRLYVLTPSLASALIVFGLIKFLIISRLIGTARDQLIISDAQLNHMNGDMMHEALRGGVISAFLSVTGAALDKIEEISVEFKKHSERLKRAPAANRSPQVDFGIHRDLPVFKNYLSFGQQIIPGTRFDQAAPDDVNMAFDALEVRQDAASEHIEGLETLLEQDNAKPRILVIFLVVGDALAALAGGTWIALWVLRSITPTEQPSASVAGTGRRSAETSAVTTAATFLPDEAATKIADWDVTVEKNEGMVKQINSMARQTTLLTLNTTIKAAKAGETPKGFAVVATEVKALARQAPEATDTIAGRIDRIQRVAGVSNVNITHEPIVQQ